MRKCRPRTSAATAGEYRRYRPSFFNVNPADRAWVDAQCTPQPLATFQQRLTLSRTLAPERITHVLATGFEHSPFRPFHALAKAKGWKTLAVASGHDVMLDRPDELTAILIDAAP